MTAAEMECCKKMAGNCDMGGGHHKCCDTALNHAAPSAATVQSAAPQVPVLAITALLGQAEMLAAQPASGLVSFVPAASPSPPGLSNVLRI